MSLIDIDKKTFNFWKIWMIFVVIGVPLLFLGCVLWVFINGTLFAISAIPKTCRINSVKYYDVRDCIYAKMNLSIIETNTTYMIEQCVDNYFASNITQCYKVLLYGNLLLNDKSLIYGCVICYLFCMIFLLIGIVTIVCSIRKIKKQMVVNVTV